VVYKGAAAKILTKQALPLSIQQILVLHNRRKGTIFSSDVQNFIAFVLVLNQTYFAFV
jgi:hypothetical protein